MNVDREPAQPSKAGPAQASSAATEAPSVSAASVPTAARPTAPAAGKKRLVAVVAILVVALVASVYYLYSRQFEETDDAQIDANISNVGSRVTGNIKAVYVVDNQAVKVGDLLAELDTSDLEVALAAARAAVAQADAQLKIEDPNVPI